MTSQTFQQRNDKQQPLNQNIVMMAQRITKSTMCFTWCPPRVRLWSTLNGKFTFLLCRTCRLQMVYHPHPNVVPPIPTRVRYRNYETHLKCKHLFSHLFSEYITYTYCLFSLLEQKHPNKYLNISKHACMLTVQHRIVWEVVQSKEKT